MPTRRCLGSAAFISQPFHANSPVFLWDSIGVLRLSQLSNLHPRLDALAIGLNWLHSKAVTMIVRKSFKGIEPVGTYADEVTVSSVGIGVGVGSSTLN